MIGFLTHREILAGSGSASLLGVGGCTLFSGRRTELSGIEVVNPYSGTERVDVRVEQADEVVVEETLSVAREEGYETVPCEWNRDGADPILEARLADAEADWERADLADRDEETAHVRIVVWPERGIMTLDVISEDDEYFVDVCADDQEA